MHSCRAIAVLPSMDLPCDCTFVVRVGDVCHVCMCFTLSHTCQLHVKTDCSGRDIGARQWGVCMLRACADRSGMAVGAFTMQVAVRLRTRRAVRAPIGAYKTIGIADTLRTLIRLHVCAGGAGTLCPALSPSAYLGHACTAACGPRCADRVWGGETESRAREGSRARQRDAEARPRERGPRLSRFSFL